MLISLIQQTQQWQFKWDFIIQQGCIQLTKSVNSESNKWFSFELPNLEKKFIGCHVNIIIFHNFRSNKYSLVKHKRLLLLLQFVTMINVTLSKYQNEYYIFILYYMSWCLQHLKPLILVINFYINKISAIANTWKKLLIAISQNGNIRAFLCLKHSWYFMVLRQS